MGKMGRPIKTVDLEKLARVCQYPMTNEDIAAILDVSVDTISRIVKKEYGITFAEYKAQKQSSLRFTLLAKQIEVAKNGNVSMLIWLGKQYLGQSEKVEQRVDQNTIQINIDASDKDL
jgi:methylphosphotriester-DNA--protein-cysteine methyltransferase